MTSIIKYWRRFWKCRKRDDRVKIMLVFAMAGIGFFIHAVYSGIQVYTILKTPVEYVLSGNGLVDNIENMADVSAVSVQRESSLKLSGPWGEMTADCVELSEAYLALAYGVSETSAMKVFYLNQMAYEQFLGASNSEELSKSAEDVHVSYVLGDGEEAGEAKLRVITKGVPNDRAYVFCAGSNARLSEGSGGLRVMLAGHDLSGMAAVQMGWFGFNIDNLYEVQQASAALEMQFTVIKYDCLVTVLCLVAVISLKKYGRHQYSHQ